MTRHLIFRKWLLLGTIATALLLAGCGGGGGSSSDPSTGDEPQTVSGTAAAGAPLVGFVGARDNAGNTTTADVAADGSFELDVSDLNPPVLIYASGIAGGNAYQLLSVAFEDDVDGTVNVTPLTDLIVGNAVGRSPQEFFNTPDFDLITQDAVEEQEVRLKTRLKPLLDGLGVDDDFNLLNSAFTADRSGIDAVLDVIEVTVDSNTNTATIRSRVDDGNQISNSFTDPDTDTTPLAVDDNLQDDVNTLQALDELAQAVASALDNQDETALADLVADDFLNNGETIDDLQARLFGSAPGIEDADELAAEIRNWSLAELGDGTAKLNIGAAQGPWEAIDENGEWKLRGNQLEFFVFVEPTHRIENGAAEPEVLGIGTMIYAGFPSEALAGPAGSSVNVSGDLSQLNGDLPFNADNDRFESFQVLAADAISSGDQVTFTWDGSFNATYTIRRGTPDLSNGAPEITTTSADLEGDEYSFEWTLPPGYDAVSVRNTFTGQQSGGAGESQDEGFTGNALANNATSFTGPLPSSYAPSEQDQLRLIARDPFGVFVAVALDNPFPDQVPPPMAEAALIGSWIARNPDSNLPWVQLTFLESGYYMHQELDLPYRPEEDDAGFTGLEFGEYSWDNETGELTVPDIVIDDNGFWGLTDTASGEESLALQVDGDTLTAYNPGAGASEGLAFTRVPLNQSGVTGSWLIQDPSDPTNVSVVTLLVDGYYFMGTNQPADDAGEPGLEFGSYTYDSDTLVLEPSPVFDQNGEFGLSDPIQGFDYATVIDGFLVIDDGEEFQLSEIDAGVTPSDGSVTVDYTAPGTGTDPEPEFGVSGDFHYLRSSSGIEGERSDGPASVYLSSYNYPGTSIVDNGDGTGSINFNDACLSDVLIDAGIDEPPTFDTATFCSGSAGSLTDLTFTARGGTLVIPAEEFTNDNGDEERLGRNEVDLFAADDARSLLLGFGKRTFGYESGQGFTSGIDTGIHVLGEKGSGMVPADLEGNWGMISFQLGDIPDNPDDIEYNVNALSINVDAQASATLTSEEVLRVIQGANTNNLFVMPESESSQEAVELGNLTLAGNGELGLFDGEFAGFLSLDQDMLFLSAADPTATGVPSDLGFHEWIAGIRRGPTPLQAADLAGKEYARFGQFYWVTEGYFEVDYAKPGSTVTFPIDSNIAEYRRRSDFTFTGFPTGSPTITGESSNSWVMTLNTPWMRTVC